MTSEHRRKLHRAAIGAEALDGLRQLVIPLVVIAFVGGGGLDRLLLFGVGGILFSVVVAYMQWETTWWAFDEDAVRLRRGILTERITTVPFDRVQAIDTVRGPVQRLFGVEELHVQAAGGGRAGEIVLKAVTTRDAAELRETVRAERVEAAPERPAPPARTWTLGRRGLLAAAATSGSLAVLAPVLAALSQALDDIVTEEQVERFLPADVTTALLVAAAAVLAVAWILSFLGTIVAFAGFTAVREEDRIRIRRGIIERREASVPVARIHAVRIVESPLREPFGLAQIRIETAGYAQEPASAQTLVPLVKRSDAQATLKHLLPELAAPTDDLHRLPPRARRRFLTIPAAAGALAAIVLAASFGAAGAAGLALVAAGVLYGEARFRAAGWRLDDASVVMRVRNLQKATAIAKPGRLQGVTRRQTILQRRADLATVEVALASKRRLSVPHLDGANAQRLTERLAMVQRAAEPGGLAGTTAG